MYLLKSIKLESVTHAAVCERIINTGVSPINTYDVYQIAKDYLYTMMGAMRCASLRHVATASCKLASARSVTTATPTPVTTARPTAPPSQALAETASHSPTRVATAPILAGAHAPPGRQHPRAAPLRGTGASAVPSRVPSTRHYASTNSRSAMTKARTSPSLTTGGHRRARTARLS